MSKIRTAEQVLLDEIALAGLEDRKNIYASNLKAVIIKSLHVYAEQLIDAAAETSSLQTCDWCTNRHKTILKLKELVK